MANSVLVASQLSAIFSSSQAEVVTVSTDRRDTPLPPAPLSSDPPSDHAIYATVFNSEYTGTIVLRVIDAGLTIELLSLTTNLPPIRFAFPAPLLPNPGIFSQDNEVDGSHEIHILAVTSSGSIFRLVLPASGDFRLWRQAFSRNWCREYMVKHGQGNLSGLVQVQGLYLIAIGLQNGSMLRLDAYTMGNEVEEGMLFIFSLHGVV
jgi:nuclear pore complex protein Nup160